MRSHSPTQSIIGNSAKQTMMWERSRAADKEIRALLPQYVCDTGLQVITKEIF
jgi:hypothetical protein